MAAVALYLHLIDWGAVSSSPLFGKDVRGRLTGLLRIAASAHQIEPTRIGTHSLRSGWADAMFVAGYDVEIIKRWGRWVSDPFSFYLWNDDRVLDTVGKGMLNSTGLLDQLQKQSARDLLKEEDRRHGRAGGKRGTSRHQDVHQGIGAGFQANRNADQRGRSREPGNSRLAG